MKITSSAACGEIQVEIYNKNITVLDVGSQFYKRKTPHTLKNYLHAKNNL